MGERMPSISVEHIEKGTMHEYSWVSINPDVVESAISVITERLLRDNHDMNQIHLRIQEELFIHNPYCES